MGLILSSCVTANKAQTSSQDSRLSSSGNAKSTSGKNAGVLLRMRGGSENSKIYISSYDPSKLSKGRPIAGATALGKTNVPLSSNSGYAYRKLKPGHYFIRSLTHNTYWAGCYAEGSYKFEVKPNTAALIGDIDMRASIQNLEAIAEEKGHQKPKILNHENYTQKIPRTYKKDILTPQIIPANEEMLADVKTSLAWRSWPTVNLPIEIAPITPTKFKPPSVLGVPFGC